VFLVFSERIRLIPAELFERAALERLGSFRTFFAVTWPAIFPLVAALFALRLCLNFGKFDILYFLAGTSALSSAVESTPLYIFRVGFVQGRLGYAAAASVILFTLTLCFVFAAVWFSRAKPRGRSLPSLSCLLRPPSIAGRYVENLAATVIRTLGIALVATAVLLPIAVALFGSLSTGSLLGEPNFNLDNFRRLFSDYAYGSALARSLQVTTLTVAFVVIIALPVSFLLNTYRFLGASASILVMSAAYCLPPIVLAYGSQSLASTSYMLGSIPAVAGGLVSIALPLAVCVLATFGDDYPLPSPAQSSSERLSVSRYLKRIFLPNRIGALCTATALAFAACWSDYLFALVIGGSRVQTATVAFQNIFQGAVIPWGVLMAGAVSLAAPTFIVSVTIEWILRRQHHEIRT
jgi:multiple sugar transport system permease protein